MRSRVFRTLAFAILLLGAPSPAGAQGGLLDPDTFYGFAGRTLAGAIQTARDEALKAGTRPIPAAMRRRLAEVFPITLLNRITYRVGEPGSVTVQALQYGDVVAVTLIDIVVFRDEADALGNDAVWAHELVHVRQYDRWGVEDFAQRYVRDHKSVEDEAYRFQAEYEARAAGTQPPS